MRLFAVILFVSILLWYAFGAGAVAWYLPVMRQEMWYLIGSGSGLWDLCAGIIAGLALTAFFRGGSHHSHHGDEDYHRSHSSYHHNHHSNRSYRSYYD